jgi:RNA polymerase subunit RPABC4/transcription elongation factor Spt4
MAVQTRVEGARGCGFRKPGGLYLVSGGLSEPCPLLPVETKVCPTCGEGIRPARGFTWVDGAKLIPPSRHGTAEHERVCPLGPKMAFELEDPEGSGYAGPYSALHGTDGGTEFVSRIGRCGLIWVGEAFYPTAASFMDEAERMGVSRRITAVPRDFVVGETWVLLGHRKAATKACPECGDEAEQDDECPVCNGARFVHIPGIITAFRPSAVEYVVKGDETGEEIEALEARGLTCVQVINQESQTALEVE